MSRRGLNTTLLAVLAAFLALSFLARRDFSEPNLEILPDMVHSPAYGTFSSNPIFADGKTLQPPPAGSIVHGRIPLGYEATPEDALRAGAELENPYSEDDGEALERGAVVFAAFCRACHGPGGLGDGPVARRGFPPPPSLVAEHARQMRDGQMFHALTYGQGNMPSHAAQLPREDRWKVIVFVRSLERAAPAAPASAGEQGEGAGRP